jgi:hypothetical protein
MIFHPAIVALLLTSGLVTLMVVYAAFFGVRILKNWDIASGSESQLTLERSTYLISTLLACAFAFQIISLFLFIYTADDLHTRFVGAMCAAGTLNVNPFGYPAFGLKIASCILGGLWLIMNYVDSRAHDYPLIRNKFILLLAIVPFAISETFFQTAYFLKLRPDIITSCCGSLFGSSRESLRGNLVALPAGPLMIAFYASLVLLTFTGFRFRVSGQGGPLFSLFAVTAFPVMALSLLSFISLYFYELPSHHCPFCILQREYGYVGYPLYGSLIGGAIFGGGVGLLLPFRRIRSLSGIVPDFSRKLALASVVLYLLFAAISIWKMATANLVLDIVRGG